MSQAKKFVSGQTQTIVKFPWLAAAFRQIKESRILWLVLCARLLGRRDISCCYSGPFASSETRRKWPSYFLKHPHLPFGDAGRPGAFHLLLPTSAQVGGTSRNCFQGISKLPSDKSWEETSPIKRLLHGCPLWGFLHRPFKYPVLATDGDSLLASHSERGSLNSHNRHSGMPISVFTK